MTAGDEDAVAVAYADPAGGTRAVTHSALATVELTWHRRGHRELALASSCAVYEYGTRPGTPGMVLQPLPEG